MKRKIALTLAIVVMLIALLVPAPTALTATDCSGSTNIGCQIKGSNVESNCEYRGEDGGTPYTSCRCQGLRAMKQCFEENNCDLHLYLELSPECYNIQ